MAQFSDYIVYVDESGDHGLVNIDPSYPVFALAFCIFEKSAYANVVTPAVQNLKFKWFGHDIVLLHEREIRKAGDPFTFLVNATLRAEFMGDITNLITRSPFTLIATVVWKDQLASRYVRPFDPYHLGMKYGLERLYKFLENRGAEKDTTFVVAEQRGKNEDRLLELEFRRICSGNNFRSEKFPFELIIAPKAVNSCGLQLADLLARPIGLRILRPRQTNKAFQTIEPKFYKRPSGVYWGFGLKVCP